MKTLASFLFVFSAFCIVVAQPQKPQSAISDKIFEYYKNSSGENIKSNLPAFEKAHPGNPYISFFNAYLESTNGFGADINSIIKNSSEFIKAVPDFKDVYEIRANAFNKKGMNELAIKDFEKYISLVSDPEDKAYQYIKIGEINLKSGDYENGFANVESAIKLQNNNLSWYDMLIKCSLNMADKSSAETRFQSLANAGDSETKLVYAKYLLYHDMVKESFAMFDNNYDVIVNSKNLSEGEKFDLLITAASSARVLNDYYRALKFGEKANEFFPNNQRYFDEMMANYYYNKEWQELEKMAKKALANREEHSMNNMYLAVAIGNLYGENAEYQKYYNRATELKNKGL